MLRYSFVWGAFAVACVLAWIDSNTNLIGFLIVFAIIWFVWTTAGQRWLLKRSFERQRLGEQEVELEASDQGVRSSTATSSSSHAWSEIRRFDETDTYFVLWINRIVALAVPKDCFTKDEERSAFAALVREKTAGQSF